MLRSSSKRIFLVALVVGIMLIGTTGFAATQAQPVPSLSDGDCVKCHSAQPAEIAGGGGKHTGLGCQGCHGGHRPSSKTNIPKCNQCHMGKPHFELKDCLSCHKNPHTPKKIAFAGTVTDACTTCHTQQIAQLRENKSRHSALYCSTCHAVHREKPACTKCHKPHAADMPATDCNKCHKAHMPKIVSYSADTPSNTCAACHKKAFDMLTASTAKHKNFSCAFCHPDKHKYVPKCQDCHGTPHPAGMHTKFPKCGDCHGIAHNVNHWSKTEAAPAAPEKKEPAPSKKKRQ